MGQRQVQWIPLCSFRWPFCLLLFLCLLHSSATWTQGAQNLTRSSFVQLFPYLQGGGRPPGLGPSQTSEGRTYDTHLSLAASAIFGSASSVWDCAKAPCPLRKGQDG